MDFDWSSDSRLYAEGKFHEAVRALIVEPGPLPARLSIAVRSIAAFKGPASPFPAGSDVCTRLDRLIARLTSTPAKGDEGSIEASVAGLDDDELHWVVDEVVDLYVTLARQNEHFHRTGSE